MPTHAGVTSRQLEYYNAFAYTQGRYSLAQTGTRAHARATGRIIVRMINAR